MLHFWRVWVTLGLSDVAASSYNSVKAFVEVIEDGREFLDDVYQLYTDGYLDYVLIGVGVIGMLAFWWWPKLSLSSFAKKPEESDGESEASVGSVDSRDEGTAVSDTELEPPSAWEQTNSAMGVLASQMSEITKAVAELKEVRSNESSPTRCPPPVPAPAQEDLQASVDRMMQRLLEHERINEVDQGHGSPVVQRARADGEEKGEKLAVQLLGSFGDVRERAMTKLKGYREMTDWQHAGKPLARCAPELIARIYQNGRTASEHVKTFIRGRELEGSHFAHELTLLGMTLDRAVREMPDDMLNYQSIEMLCRRIYAIEKAFEAVEKESDWKAPRNAGKTWKSKVAYHMLDEIDLRSLMGGDKASIRGVDEEVRERLRDKALLAKAVLKSGAAEGGEGS